MPLSPKGVYVFVIKIVFLHSPVWGLGAYPFNAAAPLTISVSSVVIAACLALL